MPTTTAESASPLLFLPLVSRSPFAFMASSTPLTAASVVGAQAPGVLPPTLCAHLDCSAIVRPLPLRLVSEAFSLHSLLFTLTVEHPFAQLVPILLGVILSCMALGSLSILAGRCWQAFPCARWRSKRALVVLVLVLQCIQTGFDIARVVSVSNAKAASKAVHS